jgi:hypothetical protein
MEMVRFDVTFSSEGGALSATLDTVATGLDDALLFVPS